MWTMTEQRYARQARQERIREREEQQRTGGGAEARQVRQEHNRERARQRQGRTIEGTEAKVQVEIGEQTNGS